MRDAALSAEIKHSGGQRRHRSAIFGQRADRWAGGKAGGHKCTACGALGSAVHTHMIHSEMDICIHPKKRDNLVKSLQAPPTGVCVCVCMDGCVRHAPVRSRSGRGNAAPAPPKWWEPSLHSRLERHPSAGDATKDSLAAATVSVSVALRTDVRCVAEDACCTHLA